MKQFFNQKWILSTVLLAALGSQYYFSVSSKNYGEIEMALQAEETPAEKALKQMAAILEQARITGPVSGDASSRARRPISSDATSAAAVVPSACPSGKCVTIDEERLRKILTEIAAKNASKDATVAKVETAEEKRKREREEAIKKRADDREAKARKLREDKEDRHEEFKEKVADLTQKCGSDISCLTSDFSLLLSRYSGDKKIDASVVQVAFRTAIAPKLKAELSLDGNLATAEILKALASDIPTTDYRFVKEAVLAEIKSAATAKAVAINKLYKDKNFIEGHQQEQELRNASDLYRYNFENGLTAAEDTLTLAYVQRTFVPEMTKLFTQISNTSSSITGTATTTTTGTQQAQGRGVVRGGTQSQTQTQGATPAVQNTQQNGNVQFGPQIKQGTGTRTGRGQN